MSKPLRVLIVEDSEDDTELLVHHLERSGYNPIYQRVDSSEAMLTALEQQQWDIVLADYSLPRFSATNALALLHSKQLDLPFIIISGSIGDGMAVAAMKAGAHDYLMKGNLARLAPAIARELQEAANRHSHQQIQSELRESEDRWQLALCGSNDGIWDWNVKTNTVFFSARWKEMLGYADDEIVNQYDQWLQRVHPDDLDWVRQAIQNHFNRKTEFYRTEHRLLCKDGTYKWILARGQALWDEFGSPTRMVGSHTDISATKQMEVALRQQAATLAAANRLKDEFLAVVSHELRTPLNPILGWSQILLSHKLDGSATVRALQTIERNAKLQKQLIEDLLDASRIIQGQLSLTVAPTDLVPIIQAAVETVRAAADAKAIQLQLLFDNSIGLVSGDAGRLQQVLWNLLSNAIKFTPAGGHVQIGLVNVNNFAQITVSDSGVGVKAEFLPYVFDRFRQENSSSTRYFGGLGLGLALTRHLVELHGGTVQVNSPGEGKGTKFTVQLPLLQVKIHEAKNASNYWLGEQDTSASRPLTKLRVLVVDDNADTRDLLVAAITEFGGDVIAAASVHEASIAVKEFNPDVLVSDIGTPDEDNCELINQLKIWQSKLGRHLPTVALTAYAQESEQTAALNAGFEMHVSKPVELDKLVAAIAQVAGRTANF